MRARRLVASSRVDSKRAYVDHSTNCLDWGVFGGQNVDADVRNRRSWTVWTPSITSFAKVRVAGSNPVFHSNISAGQAPCWACLIVS